jgi:hypothetical protein
MLNYLTQDLILNLIVFQAVLLLVILSNRAVLRRTRQHAPPERFAHVSILVPARNEQENIARCVGLAAGAKLPVV